MINQNSPIGKAPSFIGPSPSSRSSIVAAHPNNLQYANARSADDDVRLMVIGLGLHAKRTWIRYAEELSNVTTKVGVDIEPNRESLSPFAAEHGFEATFVPVGYSDSLPFTAIDELDQLIHKHRINGVIIATDPFAHRAYAEWALLRGLDILIDKPITTRQDAANDQSQARAILDDFLYLRDLYEELQQTRSTCLIVAAQRRWHPGFEMVGRQIKDIRNRFNCPVTNVQIFHSDGQWRLPDEIVNIAYHGYERAAGKASHSGYHLCDVLYHYLKAGAATGKAPNSFRVSVEFVRPSGFLTSLNPVDYAKIFGEQYGQEVSTAELNRKLRTFGEIDVSALISFRRDDDVVALANVVLQHSGFTRRSWAEPNLDNLYKQNGRVKHEHHRIDCGPFRRVEVKSCQANDRHDSCAESDFDLGGNNHFDIHTWDNCGMTGATAPLTTTRLCDLGETSRFDDSRLYMEQVKKGPFVEFVRFIHGEIGRSELRSNIDDHLLPVQLMSAMYEAGATGTAIQHEMTI